MNAVYLPPSMKLGIHQNFDKSTPLKHEKPPYKVNVPYENETPIHDNLWLINREPAPQSTREL